MKISLKTLSKENYPLLLLIPFLVYYISGLTDSWIPSVDSAVYISLGRSLITGKGYAYMGYTQARYPFLYPLILAPILGLFGKNFLLMRLVSILMGVGALGLVYLLFKRVLGQRRGLVMMLLSGTSGYYYYFCHHVLSDIPYTFFSLLVLWYFVRDRQRSKSVFVLAGLLLSAYFTRTVGVVLLGAVVLFELIEIRGNSARTIILLLIFLIPAGLWSYRNRAVSIKNRTRPNLGESVNYFDEFFSRSLKEKEREYIGITGIGRRVLHNSGYYREMATNLIIPHRFAGWTHLVPALMLVGFMGCWFKNRTLIEYYIFLYVLAYMLWPTLQGVRFYVPIVPFLLYYLLSGVVVIVESTGKWLKFPQPARERVRRAVMVLVVTILFGINFKSSWETVLYLRREGYYGESVNNFFSSVRWITHNTRPDDTIIADRAPWVYLFSERETHGFASVHDGAEVLESILKRKPNYVITGKASRHVHFLMHALDDYPHLFKEVYRKGDSAVYRVLAGGPSPPPPLPPGEARPIDGLDNGGAGLGVEG